jgi:CHAT domain-containing protein
VASGRDLLREFKPSSAPVMLVYAHPDFNAGKVREVRDEHNQLPAGVTAFRSVEIHDFQNVSLPPLPGTAREAADLSAQIKQVGWQSQVFLGANATETQLEQTNSPRVLHLATHGFFLPDNEDDQAIGENSGRHDAGDSGTGGLESKPGRKVILKNPMHRSGLAVAGALRTLQAWAKGEVPPPENDGIVTAEEVGGLKLDGTWLVVLSACDTGSGEAKAGEGVMGLRRGFVQAGAQNLLMTLWPISDLTTVQIMLDFYVAAFKTGNAPQALADVQRDALVKFRQERGLLAAVQLAGPFIMSSQGKTPR